MKARPSNKFSAIAAPLTLAILAGGAIWAGLPQSARESIPAITPAHAEQAVHIPPPARSIEEDSGEQVAVFAGGCFWGVEAVFEQLAGVSSVESGYSGGDKSGASYDLVSEGATRHAESVRVHYDPAVISYNQLLQIFFSVVHDPTQLNRQGPDSGSQYRSAIFPHNAAQEAAARDYIGQLQQASIWPEPIVTAIEPFSFFPAEEYHQDFMRKNPKNGYILRYDAPKLVNLKRLFPAALK